MCHGEQWAPPRWNAVAGRKHRRYGPRQRKLWDRSLIVAQTAEKGEPSIYDPHLEEAEIRRMEMSCVEGEGVELPCAIAHVRRFYRAFDRCIGASEGQRTNYIFVQWNSEGSVHGYPVTKRYLKSKGAAL